MCHEAGGSGVAGAEAESSSQVRLSQRHPVLLTRVAGAQQPRDLLGRWAGVVMEENSSNLWCALLGLPLVTTRAMGPCPIYPPNFTPCRAFPGEQLSSI